MHECILDLQSDGETVEFITTHSPLGKWDSSEVVQIIKALPLDALSGKLTNKLYPSVPDYECCPVCGKNDDFHMMQELTDDIQYGTCLNCGTTIHIIDGTWVSFPSRAPYRRIESRI